MGLTHFGDQVTWFGQPVAWREPMSFATYAPRCYVHPDRYGTTKTAGPNRLLVVHTSEGGELGTSAEALCSYMGQPGEVHPDGSVYGASYQYVVDTDCIRPATKDTVVAFAAAGANHDGIHYCIPGRAGQTREQWLDANSRPHIAMLAKAMVDKSAETGIPLRKLTTQEVRDGMRGVCGHVNVSEAFRRSTHTDPGALFPYDVLFDDIDRLLGDDDMTPLVTPERAYDSRPGADEQAAIDPVLGAVNAALPRTPMASGEYRRVFIGMTQQARVNVTVVGHGDGFVEVTGSNVKPKTSLVNYGSSKRVDSNGAGVATPDGHVYVWCFGAPCDVAVDVRER